MNNFWKKLSHWWDYTSNSPRSGLQVVFIIIAVNIVMMIFSSAMSKETYSTLILHGNALQEGWYWQLITSLFMHASITHILFNMYALYLFGSLSAPVMGGRSFLTMYFVAGLVGGFVWLGSVQFDPMTAALGASGAVMGVVMAAAMLRPNIQLYFLFIPYPIKLRTAAVVFVLLDIFLELIGFGGIAFTAHIGGFIGGYLYMHFFQKKIVDWDPLDSIFGRRSKKWTSHNTPPGWSAAPPPPPSSVNISVSAEEPPKSKVTQRELDYLLDKISRTGINSLSETEMERLRQAREQMRGSGR